MVDQVHHTHVHVFDSDCGAFGCCGVIAVCLLVLALAYMDKLPW